MLLIDAHVHIYDCFNLEKLFDSAYSNFKSAAKKNGHEDDFTGILLLAESTKDRWFQHLWNFAAGIELPYGRTLKNWKFYRTDENCSLNAISNESKNLILIAGRQIVSSEGLEALAIGTTHTFEDGETIYDVIKKINENESLPILPWGVGKWFGNRGRIVEDIVNANDTSIYLGDNKNRPNFWPEPRLFRVAKQRGIGIFSGSDPLPFAAEHCKVGSFGFSLNTKIRDDRPTTSLRNWILNQTIPYQPYGHLERCFPFFKNQLALRLKN